MLALLTHKTRCRFCGTSTSHSGGVREVHLGAKGRLGAVARLGGELTLPVNLALPVLTTESTVNRCTSCVAVEAEHSLEEINQLDLFRDPLTEQTRFSFENDRFRTIVAHMTERERAEAAKKKKSTPRTKVVPAPDSLFA